MVSVLADTDYPSQSAHLEPAHLRLKLGPAHQGVFSETSERSFEKARRPRALRGAFLASGLQRPYDYEDVHASLREPGMATCKLPSGLTRDFREKETN